MSTFELGGRFSERKNEMVQRVRLSGPTLQLLKLLIENPKEGQSGASISKATSIGSGTMYPLLQRLESAGWLESEWEQVEPSEAGRPRRRFYRLTRQGQGKALEALAQFQTHAAGVPSWTLSQ
ncbi:PadR family transcriptional regulator [Tardiphaga alba]|uniref:PadR family transcriptional regulator n=1 Tax=Tardiphaga alba TaxID=340268 RepID=A0ABX8A7S7_9BRAD|nr:PadR family transcriptional regulator [Tardiphaga alba]